MRLDKNDRLAKLTLVEETENEKLLKAICGLIKIDITEIHEKIKDKPTQKKYLKEELTASRKEYDKKRKSKDFHLEDLVKSVERLTQATAAFNQFGILTTGESIKLSKYARAIIDIESNKRDQIKFDGLDELSDKELMEKAKQILQRKVSNG